MAVPPRITARATLNRVPTIAEGLGRPRGYGV
jgi:hypothetical protein